MIAQKTQHDLALRGIAFATEPEEQEFLKNRAESWKAMNPDPKKDDTPEKAIMRVFYTLIERKVRNPNRPARHPYLAYEELKDKVMYINQVPLVAFEVGWKPAFDNMINHFQDFIRLRLDHQTRPRR